MQVSQLVQNVYQQLFQNSEGIKIIGPKVLILDNFTLQIISLCFTQNKISQDQVIVTFTLQELPKVICSNFVQSIIFVQPTQQNIELIKSSFTQQQQKFKYAHINFTQSLTEEVIKIIAQSDKHGIISTLRAIHIDYQPVMDNLVLAKDVQQFTSFIQSLNQKNVSVSYQKSSSKAAQFSSAIQQSIKLNQQHITEQQHNVHIIICDRSTDITSGLLPPLSFQSYIEQQFKSFQNGLLAIDDNEYPFSFFTLSQTAKRFLPLDQMTSIQQIPPLTRQLQLDMQPPRTTDTNKLSELLLKQDEIRPILHEITSLSAIVNEFKKSYDFRLRQSRIFGITRSVGDGGYLANELNRAAISLEALSSKSTKEKEQISHDECQFCLSLFLTCGDIKGVKNSILTYLAEMLVFFKDDQHYIQQTVKQIQNCQCLHNAHKSIRQQSKQIRIDLECSQFSQFRRPDFVSLLEDCQCQERAKAGYYMYRPLILEIAQLGVTENITSEVGFAGDDSPEKPVVVIYYIGGITLLECSSLYSFEYYARFNDEEQKLDGFELSRVTSSQVIVVSDSIFDRKQYLDEQITE